jgi:ferritin-like metal-binding protein YciE
MAAKTLAELFKLQLEDVFSAENQILKALPKMAQQANSQELKQAFETHLKETQNQVERLKKVFQTLGTQPSSHECEALQGIVTEAEEVMGEAADADVRDAGMIAAAQAVEHYEIARYGTLVAWAKQLGKDDVSQLLQETLKEEKHADDLLSKIAWDSVNKKAA